MNEASQDRALGRIEGRLDLIIADQEKAREARKQQYERLEKIEEPVAEFSRWRERGVGAIMLVSFIAASLGGALVAFGKKIWAVMIGA